MPMRRAPTRRRRGWRSRPAIASTYADLVRLHAAAGRRRDQPAHPRRQRAPDSGARGRRASRTTPAVARSDAGRSTRRRRARRDRRADRARPQPASPPCWAAARRAARTIELPGRAAAAQLRPAAGSRHRDRRPPARHRRRAAAHRGAGLAHPGRARRLLPQRPPVRADRPAGARHRQSASAAAPPSARPARRSACRSSPAAGSQGAYRGARADYDDAVAAYDQTLVQALREVADVAARQRALTVRLARDARRAGGVATRLRPDPGALSRRPHHLSRRAERRGCAQRQPPRRRRSRGERLRARRRARPRPRRRLPSLPSRRNPVMNKPITKEEFDIADVEAALEAEEAAKPKARKRSARSCSSASRPASLLAGGGYYGYEALHAGHVTTDNAYVGADIAQVTPLVGGPVARGAGPGHAAGAPRRRARPARRHRRAHRGRPGRGRARGRRERQVRSLHRHGQRAGAPRSPRARPTRPATAADRRRRAPTSSTPASTCSGAQALAADRRDLRRGADHRPQRAATRAAANLQAAQATLAQASAQRKAARRQPQRQPGADRRRDGRHQSRGARRPRRARAGAGRSRAHRHPRAGRRRRLAPPGPGRPAGPAGRAC